MKTIFFDLNKLHLSGKIKPGYANVFKDPTFLQLKIIIDLFLNSTNYEALIVGDKDKILKQIKNNFEHIKAAGGVVLNSNNEVLLIKRLGKWDLPKGKLETGETRRSGAIREVEEECGITGLTITCKLKPSYHVYLNKNVWILKTSYWYLMKYNGNQTLVPQAEENITEAIWLHLKKYNPETFETYPAIEKVLHQSRSLWE